MFNRVSIPSKHLLLSRYIGDAVKSWHDCLIRYGNQNGFSKLLMTSYMFAHQLTEHQNEDGLKALQYIQLLDATLDLSALDHLNKTTGLVADMVKWDAIQDRPWINWNLNFINNLPLSNAATAFQVRTLKLLHEKDHEALKQTRPNLRLTLFIHIQTKP